MGSTEFGNGGLFERERENPVKEKKKREAKEAEKSFKLKERRTRHETTRFGGALVQNSKATNRVIAIRCLFHSILFVLLYFINQSHTLTNMIKMKTI